jgi:hypothetical protein
VDYTAIFKGLAGTMADHLSKADGLELMAQVQGLVHGTIHRKVGQQGGGSAAGTAADTVPADPLRVAKRKRAVGACYSSAAGGKQKKTKK